MSSGITFLLKTKTPIHIGTGNKLDPFGLIYDDDSNMYYNVKSSLIFEELLENGKITIEQVNDYTNWIEKFAVELNNCRNDEDIKSTREKYSLQNFFKKELKSPSLLQEIISNNKFINYKGIYTNNAVKYAEVNEQIKDPMTKLPYIPGSSIKGFYRTALAMNYIDAVEFDKLDRFLFNKIKQTFENNNRNLRRTERFIDNDINTFFFNYKGGSFDPKFDIMKFIHISDAHIVKANNPIQNTIIGRFKRKKEDQNITKAELMGVKSNYEIIREGQTFSFTISVDEKGMNYANKTNYLFNEKFKYLFDKDYEKAKSNGLEKFVIDSMNGTASWISEGLLDIQKEWLSKSDNVSKDLLLFCKKLKENEATLLKLGNSTGFNSKSILLDLYNKTQEEKINNYHSFFKDIIETFGIGKNPQQRLYNIDNLDIFFGTFPKTVPYIVNSNSESPEMPIGWVTIEKK